MSRSADDREGLSPPPANILDFLGDDEDDDLYEPATEQSDFTASAAEEDEEAEFADAHEQLGDIEIMLEGPGDDDDDENDATETEDNGGPRPEVQTLTIEQLSRILSGHGPLRRLLLQRYRNVGGGRLIIGEEDDEESDEDYLYHQPRHQRRRRAKPAADRFPKVPSEAGRGLMSAGTFGSRDTHVDVRRKRRRNMSERLMWRRLGLDPRPSMGRQNALIAQELIPNTSTADKIIHYDSRAYSGQFSDDGNFFFSCTQNFKVRMYDTSNPYEWQYYKTVDFPFGQWTITDATLSPDNRWLAYSSIRHTVCLASTDPLDTSDYTLLDFTNFAPGQSRNTGRGHFGYRGHNSFGIWSLRFSGDGREIVAGTSDHSVVVYDLETRQSTVRLSNHDDDVNAVCFGDKLSPHILYSGSDDQTLRVWDRRSMADGREAGVFVGHTEGLTYVDSKGDGRYVLSNGKDQMMKLWDLRKMMSPSDFEQINLNEYTSNFDYRFSPYDEDEYTPNPHDCSVVTFRGHSVLKTLIRCHFSPPTSSNSRYVYSGSEDGKVYVWNLDGSRRATIDVMAATKGTRPRHSAREEMFMYEMPGGGRGGDTWKTCVRDASWCPTAPVLAATSWNGYGMSTGTVTLHSWAGDGAEDMDADDCAEPPMASNYNSRLDRRPDFDRGAREAREAAAAASARSGAAGRTGGYGLRSHAVRRGDGRGEEW